MKRNKTLFVEISTLDYSVTFYNERPSKYYGEVHGPYSTVGEARKEAKEIMQCYLNQYNAMMASICTVKLSDFKQESKE